MFLKNVECVDFLKAQQALCHVRELCQTPTSHQDRGISKDALTLSKGQALSKTHIQRWMGEKFCLQQF